MNCHQLCERSRTAFASPIAVGEGYVKTEHGLLPVPAMATLELLRGVHVVATPHTQLLGSSSRIPVSLQNSLPFEAAVTGTVTAASAALSVTESRIERTLVPADGNQTVLVPVDARVSSGDSGLLVRLADASGEQVFFSTEVPLSISSSVEKIALAGLSVVAALLLGFGIWRSMRRRRYRLITTQPIETGISDA